MVDEPSAVVVAQPAPSPAAVTEAAAATVEVAEIQAQRDVAVAEITAGRDVAIAEAAAEETDEDIEWLRTELSGLRAAHEANRQALADLTQVVTACQGQIAGLTGLLEAHVNMPSPPAHSAPATTEEGPAESPVDLPEAGTAAESEPASAAGTETPEEASEVKRRRARFLRRR